MIQETRFHQPFSARLYEQQWDTVSYFISLHTSGLSIFPLLSVQSECNLLFRIDVYSSKAAPDRACVCVLLSDILDGKLDTHQSYIKYSSDSFSQQYTGLQPEATP